MLAGQCSMQRPHSTHEYACRLTSRVRSLPATSPKSSSPVSGGISANSPRERKTVNGLSTRCKCLVCGITGRNASRVSVCVHHSARAAAPVVRNKERCQVSDHQHEDQQRNQSRSPGNFAQPLGPRNEPPHKQSEDAHCAGRREQSGKIEIELPHSPCRIEKPKPENRCTVVQRDQREDAERPEDQRVRYARQRPFTNDFALEQHFEDKIPHSPADGEQMKARILFRLEDLRENRPESPPEAERATKPRGPQTDLAPMRKSGGVQQKLEEKLS